MNDNPYVIQHGTSGLRISTKFIPMSLLKKKIEALKEMIHHKCFRFMMSQQELRHRWASTTERANGVLERAYSHLQEPILRVSSHLCVQ